MIRIICKCKECGEELEFSLPAINSIGDFELIVVPCDCGEFPAEDED